MLSFQSGRAAMVVDPEAGGRIASLRIDDRPVLVERRPDPMRWGCYPMVPFAGRVRRGRFTFDGREFELPCNLPPHAIHGYGFLEPWQPLSDDMIEFRLTPPWPFPGRVEQTFSLTDSQLRLEMTVESEVRQPLTMGWHPWFLRDRGDGSDLALDFGAARMYELDEEEIPTGRLVQPAPPPWDNCFAEVSQGPSLRWGSGLTVDIRSSCDLWVVYDHPRDSVCVEPQTGPPDALNLGPPVVEAGERATAWMVLSWGV